MKEIVIGFDKLARSVGDFSAESEILAAFEKGEEEYWTSSVIAIDVARLLHAQKRIKIKNLVYKFDFIINDFEVDENGDCNSSEFYYIRHLFDYWPTVLSGLARIRKSNRKTL